jgi:hypothetical protein
MSIEQSFILIPPPSPSAIPRKTAPLPLSSPSPFRRIPHSIFYHSATISMTILATKIFYYSANSFQLKATNLKNFFFFYLLPSRKYSIFFHQATIFKH